MNQTIALLHDLVETRSNNRLDFDRLKERRGIELGEVRVLVEACPIEGRRY